MFCKYHIFVIYELQILKLYGVTKNKQIMRMPTNFAISPFVKVYHFKKLKSITLRKIVYGQYGS